MFNMRKALQHLMEDHPVAPLGKVNTFFNETEKVNYYLTSEYDMKNEGISVHDFYKYHLSKSLPAVLRNECSDWGLKQKLDASTGTEIERHNATFNDLFKVSISHLAVNLSYVSYTEL